MYKYGTRRRPQYREIHLFLATLLCCHRLPHPIADVPSVSEEQTPKIAMCFFLKTKDEAFECFKTYKAKVENQLEKKIKRVRSDRGGEYFSNEFDLFCAENRIIHE